jgi:hypothetical protein
MRIQLLGALALALLTAACNSPAAVTGQGTASTQAPPPWPAPTDASARILAAGLEPLASEGSLVHYHAHLDVFYNGQPVLVPALVGIDMGQSRISALHTHQDSGVLHVESPKEQVITLGQFFTEWNVPLAGAKVYVEGKEVADGAAVALADHQQIAVVFGTPPAQVPASYAGAWF